jgi:hypothetical protein
MSNELSEAERAAAEILWREYDGEDYDPEDGGHEAALLDHAELAREFVAAVEPIVKRETMDRFGDRMGRFNS